MARTFIGATLRVRRREAGLRPEELALAIGRSVYAIHEYERGRAKPPVDVLARIADVLGCTVDDLLTTSAPPPAQGTQQGEGIGHVA